MSRLQEKKRTKLILISRYMQKPGTWITERIVSGQLTDSISSFFPEVRDLESGLSIHPLPLTDLLSLIASYQRQTPEELQKILSRQYIRWTTVETNTMGIATPLSPFKESQDPLRSYRHLPGQELIEWFHCCGMKMPERFIGRPDSIHMKLEFTVYLSGNISSHPDDPDHQKIYDTFLQRFLFPHIDRILAQRCGREQFPFYYLLCGLIRYLT